MAPAPWLVWLTAADAAMFQAAYPHAQFVRHDTVEPGIVVYQVTLDVQPGPTTFPLVDGAVWNHVLGEYAIAAQPDRVVEAIPYHWHWNLNIPPVPETTPPPGAVTWQPDQWVVTDDGSGPTFFKAAATGWDEQDDLYEVRVFDTQDAAMNWVDERSVFYRQQEEPPYDEDADEDEWDEEADEDEDADEDGRV